MPDFMLENAVHLDQSRKKKQVLQKLKKVLLQTSVFDL